MFKTLLISLVILIICFAPAIGQELVTKFDEQNITILNDEIRKLRDEIKDLKARVTSTEARLTAGGL